MPRENVKQHTQEKLDTWVWRKSMQDIREVKRITGMMIADQVRSALEMHCRMMREQGVLPIGEGQAPPEMWPRFVRDVRDALHQYTSTVLRPALIHGEGGGEQKEPVAVLSDRLRDALERYYGEQLVGERPRVERKEDTKEGDAAVGATGGKT